MCGVALAPEKMLSEPTQPALSPPFLWGEAASFIRNGSVLVPDNVGILGDSLQFSPLLAKIRILVAPHTPFWLKQQWDSGAMGGSCATEEWDGMEMQRAALCSSSMCSLTVAH